jgi:hypothetical protein
MPTSHPRDIHSGGGGGGSLPIVGILASLLLGLQKPNDYNGLNGAHLARFALGSQKPNDYNGLNGRKVGTGCAARLQRVMHLASLCCLGHKSPMVTTD